MAAPSPTPVTLLAGFLGAGKSSLLKQLLQNKAGLKVAVLVNDVAEMEIDSAEINGAEGSTGSDKKDVLELKNGCACSAADEIVQGVEALMKLSRERGVPWNHIVVDPSLVADPREIRDSFRNAVVAQPELLRGTKLHAMATVLDASMFVAEFEKRNKMHERPDLGMSEPGAQGNRQVCDLMCAQIECADILILNNAELIDTPEHLALLKATVSNLNADAQLYTSEAGEVELTKVLGAATGGGVCDMDEDMEHRRMVDAAKRLAAAQPASADTNGYTHDEQADGASAEAPAPPTTKPRPGISSFCYQRRLPFHPHRLMGVIRELPVRFESLALSQSLDGDDTEEPTAGAGRSPMRCLIRSKGLVWLSNSHTQIFYWALAGKHFELKHYASWWASHPRDEWPTDEAEVASITKDFEGDMGDRRQELIFVGVNMDAAAITKLLDDCLLRPAEMAEYRKRERPEPEDAADGAAGA